MKQCTKCKIEKKFSDFYKNKSQLKSRCKACLLEITKEQRKNYYWKNKENRREQNTLIAFKTRIKNRYNISFDDYEKLLIIQEFKCKICWISQRKLRKKLVIDHDHKTGFVRGLLCEHCNFALGHFKDQIFALERAIEYLKE